MTVNSGNIRPGWDEYFLGIAKAVAARGECVRSRVGAVLVINRRIVATGYNGVPAGERSCLDGACPRARNTVPRGTLYDGPGRCIATHAEINAIDDYETRVGLLAPGATMYLTKEPCEVCEPILTVTYGLRVVWEDDTR
jgi:dCMP deaminase